jgi:hypothetical protein
MPILFVEIEKYPISQNRLTITLCTKWGDNFRNKVDRVMLLVRVMTCALLSKAPTFTRVNGNVLIPSHKC